MPQSTTHRRAWIDARLAEHAAAERAKNPKLTASLDAIERAFPHPNPPSLEDRYPFIALNLSLEYARRFQGANVLIGDGFVEVETRDLGGDRHRVAA
ncbi:hypothetical protein GGQ97_002334 [Sphingomonas kaistensis]|uniref:Uncharacterized protein n=1 Tax=Sphingomonas kaistensis TaxID=298708 RepID=A0A7X5Y7Q5_9SPHN|nr:hypothetical protein [Sphingomonas kaistensis]NJC06541.1 hypothetical protein [Sphingomonas kaistensis]